MFRRLLRKRNGGAEQQARTKDELRQQRAGAMHRSTTQSDAWVQGRGSYVDEGRPRK